MHRLRSAHAEELLVLAKLKSTVTHLSLLLLLATFCMQRSSAHHSPAQYNESETVEKEAIVVRYEFRNPHSYILVRDSDNAEWMLEASSAVRLRRDGWSADLFAPGDQISFRANTNRNPQRNRLYLNSVTTAGGKTYTLHDDQEEPADSAPVAGASSLEGVWRVDTQNFDELFDMFERHPLTTEARQAQAAYKETMDPVADCVAYPTPYLVLVSFIYPMSIEVAEDTVVFHHEFYNTTRTVYMDGRGHPPDTVRTNQGHSIGRWDGRTLVIDTRYFADHRNPMLGDFPSGPDKHVIERYTLSDDGMNAVVEFLVEDNDYLAEPLRFALTLLYSPNEELQDFDCDPEIARRFTE